MRTWVGIEVGADVERPAGEVWAMVSDATRLPEWLGEFEEVVQQGGGPCRTGNGLPLQAQSRTR